jgi:uracil-DNA glycosylase family 4
MTLGQRKIQPVRTSGVPGITAPANDATYRPLSRGTKGAPILVVCDPPHPRAHDAGLPTSVDNLRMFATAAQHVGMEKTDFLFVSLCPPLPEAALHSASRKWAHVQPCVEALLAEIEANGPKCIVTLGELATRAVLGRAVAITKARGAAVQHGDRIVVPFLSPGFIARVPDHRPTFDADMLTLANLKECGYSLAAHADQQIDTDYRWCEDLSELIAYEPQILAVDCETTGLRWHDDSVQVITVQLCWTPGKAVAIPVDPTYWPSMGQRKRNRLINQLKTLLEDPRIRKVGHNLKFDKHMLRKLGVELRGWTDDTMQMLWAVDENSMTFNLDEGVRRFVPPMAGYADEFNRTVDKANMRGVPPEKMLGYACGDVDACLRLYLTLSEILRRDRHQFTTYHRIQMPALRVFGDVIERHGMLIDQERLTTFSREVEDWVNAEYAELIRMVPPKVRRAHLEAGERLEFSRSKFVKDILFTADGFNLTPVVWTKSTAKFENVEEREPSTSAKDHLPYFTERDDAAGEFVRRLIDFQKSQKLLGTYLNGFWKYIASTGCIYPSYALHKTVTGRTASQDPNGQNFPKRGRWAKSYQKIFKAKEGYRLVSCDLSQIELRIAAWMANEPTMLRIYREGGDIHTATAKAVAQLTDAQWNALPPGERKLLRTKAKAVNFGFLYGMGWKKFMAYAKTDYGVTYTEAEAKRTRQLFFATYSALNDWHIRMREQAKDGGFVRALHGAKRNLPSIFSADEAIKSGAERQAINSPVQRFGSDLGLLAMVAFSRQADPEMFRIIGFIHDALVMEVKIGHEVEGIEALLYAMQNPPLHYFRINAPIPILAEADIGMNGGEMIELAELPPPDKRPDWFAGLGMEVRNIDGKDVAMVEARKPEWWNDSLDAQADADFRAACIAVTA